MPTRPRIVVLVSKDFGELTNALTFARSPGLDVTLLLPPNLHQACPPHWPINALCYTGLDEVAAVVQQIRPDALLLFSGYLFVANRLFEFDAFAAWLRQLQDEGLPVLTSDAFLGVLRGDLSMVFSTDHPARYWVAQHFARAREFLQHLPHVYTLPCAGIEGSDRTSYRLPAVVDRVASREARRQRLARAARPLEEDRFWMFVLASEDWKLQCELVGEMSMAQAICARMQDALRHERVPVLIAPQACARAVERLLPPGTQAWCLPFCDYEMFEDLLLGAEHAFYWNQCSNSNLLRLYNALPTWFFDRGHMLRWAPGLTRQVHQIMYTGMDMSTLELFQAIDLRQLEKRAAELAAARHMLAFRYGVLPSAEELVQRSLARARLHDAVPAEPAA
jgi:hypothetical protein